MGNVRIFYTLIENFIEDFATFRSNSERLRLIGISVL